MGRVVPARCVGIPETPPRGSGRGETGGPPNTVAPPVTDRVGGASLMMAGRGGTGLGGRLVPRRGLLHLPPPCATLLLPAPPCSSLLHLALLHLLHRVESTLLHPFTPAWSPGWSPEWGPWLGFRQSLCHRGRPPSCGMIPAGMMTGLPWRPPSWRLHGSPVRTCLQWSDSMSHAA